MNEILNAIQNVGFPIIACYFMYQQVIKLQSIITELSVTLKGIDTRLQELETKTSRDLK